MLALLYCLYVLEECCLFTCGFGWFGISAFVTCLFSICCFVLIRCLILCLLFDLGFANYFGWLLFSLYMLDWLCFAWFICCACLFGFVLFSVVCFVLVNSVVVFIFWVYVALLIWLFIIVFVMFYCFVGCCLVDLLVVVIVGDICFCWMFDWLLVVCVIILFGW